MPAGVTQQSIPLAVYSVGTCGNGAAARRWVGFSISTSFDRAGLDPPIRLAQSSTRWRPPSGIPSRLRPQKSHVLFLSRRGPPKLSGDQLHVVSPPPGLPGAIFWLSTMGCRPPTARTAHWTMRGLWPTWRMQCVPSTGLAPDDLAPGYPGGLRSGAARHLLVEHWAHRPRPSHSYRFSDAHPSRQSSSRREVPLSQEEPPGSSIIRAMAVLRD